MKFGALIHRGLAGTALALAGLSAQATAYTFPGNLPAGCSGSAGSYVCGALSLAYGDTVAIAAPKPATLTVNGDFSTNTSSINAAGTAADLRLVVSGTLTLGYNASLNANITAGAVVEGSSGACSLGGSVTTTGSGAITLGYTTAVAGSLSSNAGTITIGQSGSVGGSISSSTGPVSLGYAASVGGAISTAGAVSVGQSATVKGSIGGSGGAVDIGYGAQVAAVSTGSGSINIAQSATATGCVKSSGSAAITLGYSAAVNSVCCGSSCGNSCVVNNSALAMPKACAVAATMQTISYVGSTDIGSAVQAATMTLKAPAGIAAGDVMIAGVAQGAVATWTAPSGWTLVKTSSGSVANTLSAWSRVATAADPAGTAYVFKSGSSSDAFGGIQAWRGVDTGTPVAAVAIQANGSALNSTAPSISPGVINTVLVTMWGDGDASITLPTGMTATVGGPSGTKKGNVSLLSAYEKRATAGATGTRTATLSDTVVSNGLALALQPGVLNSVDHYEVSLPAGSLACTPSTVTVTACSDSSSPCTSAATGLGGQTASLATSAGSLGASSLTFNSSGVASTSLSDPTASDGTVVSVTLSGEQSAATNARSCCPNGSSCAAANSCSTTFHTAGFLIAASANGAAATLPAQTAGTASAGYVLRAVKTGSSTLACEAAIAGTAQVSWAYRCNNPATCSSGNLGTLSGSGATSISGTSNAGVGGSSPVPMSFDANGNAPFSFSYADVGQITLAASLSLNGATLNGSSNAFVVKPAGFAVSAIQQTASPKLANPAAASAAGAKFVKAGEAFSVTVTALTSSGATAPNYGRESSPEGVVLAPTLVLPAGGVAGSLANSTLAGSSFSNGVASASNLSFSEVGIITLTPSVADGDYLGAGNVSGAASGNVGRFVPAGFALSAGTVSHRAALACAPASAFSYLGETFKLGLNLTAQNSGGATTQNYSDSFARLDLATASNWGLAGIAGSTVFSVASGRLALGSASGSWSKGVASGASLTAVATRAASPEGPYNASFGIAPVDSDGVAMNAYDLDADSTSAGADHSSVGSVALRFGRMRLSNAIGAADRALALPVSAQYWTGSAWDTNTLDSCTAVAAGAVSFGNLRRSLTAGDGAVATAISMAAGVATLKLKPPATGHSGTLDVALSLGAAAADASCLQAWTPVSGASAGANLAFLRGAWCGSSYDKDPAARATFGLQRSQDNLVYRQENY